MKESDEDVHVWLARVKPTDALGYATVWLTGWAAYDVDARRTLRVRPAENIAGFIHIGTARSHPPDRPRPILEELVTSWTAP